MKNLMFFLLLLICNSCYSKENKQECIDILRNNSANNELSKTVIEGLKDSIQKWSNLEILSYQNIFEKCNLYFDDLVLFTADSNRAFSWYFKIYKDKNIKLQGITLFVAEYKNKCWNYYLEGMPHITYLQEMNDGKPWTKEQLQQEMDNDLMKHLDVKNCKIVDQDKIINDYFQGTWGLYDMEKKMWDSYYKEKAKKE